MRLIIFVISILLGFSSVKIKAQEIQSVELVSEITQGTGQLLLLSLGINTSLDSGIDIYRVTYSTTGTDGQSDVASGLFMMPSEFEGSLPIMIYQHGTTDGSDDVPSKLQGGYQLGAIFAGKGMAVLAPDFLGMGTSRGFHPYVHADTEATAAVDMLEAMRSFMTEQSIEWNEQLFITGYSQGGHAAMAAHRHIELLLPDRYTVTANLPMSGPYSISGVMRDLAFSDVPYNFPAYLVYSDRALKEVNPLLYESEADIFKPEFLPAINEFISTKNGLFSMNQSLVQTLLENYDEAVPKQIFVDEFRESIETDDNHPFNIGLRESDLYDWIPQAPVLMLYCKSDDQVPFRNSIIADSVMNENGAMEVTSIDVSGGLDFDHSDCIVPALNEGIPWIFNFVDTSTPTLEIVNSKSTTIYPNPTYGPLNINSDKPIQLIELYNINGQKMAYSKEMNSRTSSLNLSQFETGIYLIHLYSEEGVVIKKLVLQN